MRVVLDANVFASALIRPQGPPGTILALLLREQAFELVLSPVIVDEVQRVLRYPRVRKHLALSDDELDLWLVALEIVAVPVPGDLEVDVVAADPDDNKYLAAAVEGLADLVVTGDDHLLGMKAYEGLQIVRAREFLELLRQPSG
ncbi:MAG: putative toxin-antitoxin system toxin component, PIN family [Actinobacteria bacterium]|nr:putative toxin-antitoxin system toxin component, PIN family [Actinomycetota bacterium]